MNLLTKAAVACAGISFASTIVAQSSERLSFEVASVKECPAGYRDTRVQFLPGGRFVAKGIPLVVVIAIAYGLPLQSDRLAGGPDWIRTAYDIQAVAEQSAIAPEAPATSRDRTLRLMLQTLLADRFHLQLNRETREGLVYEIAVKNDGPRLKKSRLSERDCINAPTSPAPGDPAACHTFAGGAMQGVRAGAASMSDLASWMLNWADHPVIDRTGLEGLFDIQTEAWLPLRGKGVPPEPGSVASDDARPTLFQIFDRLGLKLELKKGTVETFVITHVERPTAN